MRNHADHRFAGFGQDDVESRPQQVDVAAEFIQNDPLHPVLFLRFQQADRTDHGGNRAAPVDIGDQKYRRLDHQGDPHVDDVIRLQVHFGRTAGPFDHHDVIALLQFIQAIANHAKQFFAITGMIFRRGHHANRPAHDDNL